MISVNTQSSIKIDNVYFDPFMIKEKYNDASLIFITHPHYDHFDLESINNVVNEDTVIIVPNDDSIINELKDYNIKIVKSDEEYEVNGVKFKTVPAYNLNKPYHKKEYGWLGYVVTLDNKYYVMGDTDFISEAEEVKCDYLFIPIGGTYTMNYEEAASLTNIIKPKVVVPIHYGSIVGDMNDGEKFGKLINSDIQLSLMLKK